ncbi:uncharacterized protein [Chironomus tepperi]|uniref:uncharacterized protein n=1 Tax=Chironomus tepperi TaxID=113505 RepID=UPI00391F9989
MDKNLKTIGVTISNDDIVYPFNLQAYDDLLIQRMKFSCEVFSYNHDNITPTNIQLSSTKTPKPTEYPQLSVNKNKVYDSADHNEKNYIMMHPYLLPDCTLRNTHYMKSEMSPFAEKTGYILACLTSSGLIELYNYNDDTCELKSIDVNFSELRKSSLKIPPRDIIKLDVLRKTLSKVTFSNFEWCAIPFEDYKLLICTTKSDDLIIYHIQDDTVAEMKSIKIEGIGRNKLKWMDMNDQHYIVCSTDKGDLVRYSVEIEDDGIVNDIQKVDVIEGKLKQPINYIGIDYHETSTILFCCKGHTLEIFHLKEDKVELVCSKYVDMTITGFTLCDNLEYMLCTLNSRVYHIQLTIENDRMMLSTFNRLEFDSAMDDLDISSNYSFYGIGASKNNVLIFLSCYPQNAYDHLINKQPNHISINLFVKHDPVQIILNNPTLRMTDYIDCIEAIRFIGSNKLETLGVLEQMDYDIAMNYKFLYYLKIQLLLINIKLIYYQMKSRNIFDIIDQSKESIGELIRVINTELLLNAMFKSKTLTDAHYTVIRSLKKLIIKYCNSVQDKEPFNTALETLKPQLFETLNICNEKLKGKKVQPEMCSFCFEEIGDDQLECSSSHKLKRCVTTNLPVSLDCTNFCKQCRESVTSLEILSLIIEHPLKFDIFLCPLCDLKFVLNE